MTSLDKVSCLKTLNSCFYFTFRVKTRISVLCGFYDDCSVCRIHSDPVPPPTGLLNKPKEDPIFDNIR